MWIIAIHARDHWSKTNPKTKMKKLLNGTIHVMSNFFMGCSNQNAINRNIYCIGTLNFCKMIEQKENIKISYLLIH